MINSDEPSPPELPRYYKMAETGPDLLRKVLEKNGWLPYVEGESPYWNLSWKGKIKENMRVRADALIQGSRYTQAEYETCKSFQRLNHFPKTAVITRKDCLFRTLKTMKGIYGSIYNFFPQSFSLPNDYIRFVRVYAEEDEKGLRSTWICKPADLSRGRKIFVFKNLQDLSYDCNAVLQRYVPNPMLISGYKYDLRCYVCVRSFYPLNIYLYNEGLTRFATSLRKPNHPMEGCFELYGFDIIVDSQLKPWLLEVNLSPALSVDSEVDIAVKSPLLADVVELSGISHKDAQAAQDYMNDQHFMKTEPRLYKRRASSASLSQPQPARKTSQPTLYPDQVGGFEKIFPFNDMTAKSGDFQIGKNQSKILLVLSAPNISMHLTSLAPEVLLDIARHLKPKTGSLKGIYDKHDGVPRLDRSLLHLSQTCKRLQFLASHILIDAGLAQHFHLVPGSAPYPPSYIESITIQGNDFRHKVIRSTTAHVAFIESLTRLKRLTLYSSNAAETEVLENIIAALPAKAAITSLAAHGFDEQGHDGSLNFRLQPHLFVNITSLDLFCMVNHDDYQSIGQCVHLETLKLQSCFDDNREKMFDAKDTVIDYKGLVKLQDLMLMGYGIGHTLCFWNALPVQVLKKAEILIWRYEYDQGDDDAAKEEEDWAERAQEEWDLVKSKQAGAVISFRISFDFDEEWFP
ncbi:tubulin-tyrosine ligase family-domain-containing protein [Obelidium mucronatum]|nr:tubulin-tyrosine ligase family-domain-containing protein [Obelidium mucronatum]